MLRTRPKWPDAKECCGREIQTTRIGRKRAWWAQGPAIEMFEQDIQPEIEAILRNVDVKDAEIYFRIYMIGKNEEASRPTIMVCCADVSIGRRAKESLRRSSILCNNTGFALGSVDFPLEQLVPAQGLASEIKAHSLHKVLEAGSNSAPEVQVFATSHIPTIGRRLFVTHSRDKDTIRYSTGGVVVTAHGRFYQLTVGHISDLKDCAQATSSMDPDACSFDGQSDSEGEDGRSIFEQNMRRASMSLFDLSDSESCDAETESNASNTINCGSPACTDYMTTNSNATGYFSHAPDESVESPPLVRVGRIALQSKEGGKPNLDYALVSIQTPQEEDPVNEITLGPGKSSKTLRIRDVTDVGREERRVIAITGSGGIMKGMLIPGTTFLGRANQQQPQKLHVVQLDGVVAEGDSGAAVVDETSGDLYGHMVSGCPGTHVAYIVAATEIFEALSAQLNGQISLVSHRKIQKSPMPTFKANRETSNPTEYQEQDARSTEGLLHHGDSTSSFRSMQTQGNLPLKEQQAVDIVHPSPSSIIKACDPAFSERTRPDDAQGCSASWVVRGGKFGGVMIESYDDEPKVHMATAQDLMLDIEASSPRQTRAQFGLLPNYPDEGRGDDAQRFKPRKKKARRRKHTRSRQAKRREGAGVERSGYCKRKHQQTRENITNQEPRGDGIDSFLDTGSKSSLRRQFLAENIPYVYLFGDDFDEMSLAYYFMTKDGTLPRRNYQAEVVDSFCPQSTFKDLQSHSQNLPSRKVCLVDDRTNDGINSISLGDYGPLTAQKLYLKLKEKRFHDRDEHSPEPPNSVSPSSRESPLPLDADRRLVFITDIDRYAVAALMATAPLSQVTALGDTLYMHLAFKAYIGASIQTRGFPFFSLSFHLPYFAWRSTTPQEQPRDNRLNRAGHPVRKVIDVSFLTSGVTPQITFKQGDYLCEAQMSVLVLGPDDCRWTGLCLVDTYFDSEDQRECVDKYHADVPDGIQSDPFTEGIFDVHLPILDPREYFLAVLDCRAKVFMEEWKHSADKLAHRIDGYIAEHPFISKHSTSPPGTELRPFLSCIGQTRQHLREFIECLRAPIRHWDDFKHRERFRTAAECRYISSIQETFVAAGHCLNQLESLCKRCDDLAKYLALCMNDEGSRGMKLQARLTQYNHTLTHVFLYFCFPPILAAGMLSMHEEAIPGVLGPAKQSFIVLTIFLTTLVFIIVGFMQRWRDILLFVYDLVGTERIKIFAGKLTSPGGHDEDIELGGRLQ